MHLLNPRGAGMRDTNMHIGFAQHMPHLAAIPPGHTDDHHIAGMGCFNGRQDVGRIAAGGDRQQHIARLAQGAHLARKYRVERVIIANRSQDRRVGGQCNCRQFRPFALKTPHEFRAEMLGIGG